MGSAAAFVVAVETRGEAARLLDGRWVLSSAPCPDTTLAAAATWAGPLTHLVNLAAAVGVV
jgi:hypothetical protein